MALIDSYAVFFTPGVIFLWNLLKPPMIHHTIQMVSVSCSDGDIKEHDQKALNSLNLAKVTQKTCKLDICKY